MMADEERRLGGIAHLDDALRLLDAARDRLLEQYVADPGIQRTLDRFHVKAVRQSDRDGIEVLLLEQKPVVLVSFDPQLGGHRLGLLAEAGNGHKIDFIVSDCVARDLRPLVQPENGQSYISHSIPLLESAARPSETAPNATAHGLAAEEKRQTAP